MRATPPNEEPAAATTTNPWTSSTATPRTRALAHHERADVKLDRGPGLGAGLRRAGRQGFEELRVIGRVRGGGRAAI